MRHQRLDPRRLQGHAGRSQGAARAAGRVARRDLRRSRSTRRSTSTRSRASCSASARESYVVGSHEFYLGYAIAQQQAALPRRRPLPPDRERSPTRSPRVLHVPARDPAARQPRRALGQRPRRDARPTSCRRSPQEIVRGDYLDRVHIGLDFFDASINRVAAWVIGTRNMLKALLIALLEPADDAAQARSGRRLHRAAGAAGGIEDAAVRRGVGSLLRSRSVPVGGAWLKEIKTYEDEVLRVVPDSVRLPASSSQLPGMVASSVMRSNVRQSGSAGRSTSRRHQADLARAGGHASGARRADTTPSFSIRDTNDLFGYVEFDSQERWEAVAATEVCRRWWRHMRDVMPSPDDDSASHAAAHRGLSHRAALSPIRP